MSKKYEILLNFVKDLSSETPNAETYFFVKKNINNYIMNIDIKSKPIKDKIVEVDTKIIFKDKDNNEKKSHFELTYTSLVKIVSELKDKKELEKIFLCDVQNEVYPKIEKIFVNLLRESGFPEIKSGKKIDFEKLYNERSN
tara:strand:- start:500 stop:922 length:423 start_codon:yes stop_codon:yes gene_type:complete